MSDVSNAGSGNPFEDLMKHILTQGLGAGTPAADTSGDTKAAASKNESTAKQAADSGKADAKAQTDQTAAGPAPILPGALTSNIVTQGQPAMVTPANPTQGGKPQTGLFDILKLLQTSDGGVPNAQVAPVPGVPANPQDTRHSGAHNIMSMLSSLMGGGGGAAGASGAAGAAGGAGGIMKMLAAFL